MFNIQNIWSIKKLSEWFMYTTILCSLLTISGFVSESRISQQGIVHTETRVTIQNNSRSTVPYSQLSISSTVAAPDPDYEAIYRNAFLVHYERIIVTKLLNNLQHWFSCNRPDKLVRTPYTRRSYNESALNALMG